jgi:hypothetical protein
MWMKFKQSQITQRGNQGEVEVSVNMDKVVAIQAGEAGVTRLFLAVAHDVTDHRGACWIDVLQTKEELDKIVGAAEKQAG